jgi:hypothetical protein
VPAMLESSQELTWVHSGQDMSCHIPLTELQIGLAPCEECLRWELSDSRYAERPTASLRSRYLSSEAPMRAGSGEMARNGEGIVAC